jgi:hypothetical protein
MRGSERAELFDISVRRSAYLIALCALWEIGRRGQKQQNPTIGAIFAKHVGQKPAVLQFTLQGPMGSGRLERRHLPSLR